VERREREAIMRQGVERAETPRDRTEREALAEDLRSNPLVGEPLRRRLRNFRPDATAQLAALGGPLAWMRRLRAIEIAIQLHEMQLGDAYHALRDDYADDPEGFAHAWRELAEDWDFHEVNGLIDTHNRHYPAESRLPMNPRTGDFVLVNGRPYTRAPLDSDWILSRFPADG
jgi:broad specificity phosphatase PhoE